MPNFPFQEFDAIFPDDDACLHHIWMKRYSDGYACPDCGRQGLFKRVGKRRAYACACGRQVHPTAGTILQGSSTSLRSWLQAMYHLAESKNGMSALELSRVMGVSYPTALRMWRKIRDLMKDGGDLLSGKVEADETFIGCKEKNRHYSKRLRVGRGTAGKAAVFGIAEKKGRIRAWSVPGTDRKDLIPLLRANVEPGAEITTDEHRSYRTLGMEGWGHRRVNHGKGEYAKKDGTTTNNIESAWSQIKRSLDGTYHCVSRRWLQSYLDEFCFRRNARVSGRHPFWVLLARLWGTPGPGG